MISERQDSRRNPKAEVRRPKEGRGPKSESDTAGNVSGPASSFWEREEVRHDDPAFGIRVSDLGRL